MATVKSSQDVGSRADLFRRTTEPLVPKQTVAPPPPPPAPTSPAAAQGDAFLPSTNPKGSQRTSQQATPATTLLTENIQDGQSNCLDRVGDWLELASPQIQGRSEVLFLRDTRPGAEGQTGHAVIRQGDTIFDPMTRQSFPSFAAFNAQGNYAIAGSVGGAAMAKVLLTEPGSEARRDAIDRARIPPALANMLLADDTAAPPPPPQQGTTLESNVRLRQDPGTPDGASEMPKGTGFTLLEPYDGNGFYHVTADVPGKGAMQGWVSADPTLSQLIEPPPPPPPPPPPEGFTNGDRVRLRTSPDTTVDAFYMDNGTHFTLLEPYDGNGYYHVKADLPGGEVREGWVSTEFSKLQEPEQTAAPSAAASDPNLRITSAGNVRLRSEPEKAEETLLGELPAGAKLTLLDPEPKDGWYHVSTELDGKKVEGYVAAEFTAAAPAGADPNSIAGRTPRYAQGNSDWATSPLNNNQTADADGKYEDTIRSGGCAISSVAMAMSNTLQMYGYPSITPADVDSYLDAHEGYTDQSGVRWGVPEGAGQMPVVMDSAKYSTGALDNALNQGLAVVMQVEVDKTADKNGWMHFVCIVGRSEAEDGTVTYQAYDPGYRDGSSKDAAMVTFTVTPPDNTLHATNPGGGTYDTTADTGLHWYGPSDQMIAAGVQQ